MPRPQTISRCTRKEATQHAIDVLTRAGFTIELSTCYSGSVKRRPATLYTIDRGDEFHIQSITAGIVCGIAYAYELGQEN